MTNYFAFFGLLPAPVLDEAALKKAFYANSRRYHPDFHTLEDEATRDAVLEKSTLNNQAYKVLADPDLRLRHLLELRGALGEEGTNSVPQDFLLEIMDVNEALMELELDDDPAARARIEALVAGLEASLDREIADLFNQYDDATVSPAELDRLRDYYLKKRYLLRLRGKI
ncbi:Fe-S protein assembly co-chaperone HscB [Neolewinella lacunae]|uniref:Fe-S protein assembly co-chaperone HscB n=1 Tax=Neolewinella lacunae TaxID=1517758 RepID=A0A923PNM6_9BACT|nr:Fe-S protein assembly co-chaperone HscB [Neolewinella lacunae]MBC6996036.1 Fe-S protein assembly co-chaperone HscB [Neolewinella lacunae]MDN3635425.1 Fe-S protein assembly co-chaperone HscB [Neolewinella lacunae]